MLGVWMHRFFQSANCGDAVLYTRVWI